MTSSHDPSAPTLSLALQSDPPWLNLGVAGVCAACIALFAAAFSRTAFSPALGVLPGLTAGVFLGSAMASRARRRGASLSLDVVSSKLRVQAPAEAHELVDLRAPFSAALLVDARPGRRMLVVGQRGDPMVVLERTEAATEPAPSAWAPRTLTLDLEALALSPASPNVVALAEGATLGPLLERLAPALTADEPLFAQPTQGGATLQVFADEVRFGARVIPLDARTKALNYAVNAQGAPLAGLGLARDEEGSVLLLGCEDALVEKGAVTGNLTPDAYVPLAVYELLRAIVEHRARAGG